MKNTLLLSLAGVCAFAQLQPKEYMFIGSEPMGIEKLLGGPIKGAPYTATITTESIQTLPDGNRIVQKHTTSVARDSQGRMRQEISLPAIAGLAPEKVPHLVVVSDPVSEESFTLNLTDKSVVRKPLGRRATLVTKEETRVPAPEGAHIMKIEAERAHSKSRQRMEMKQESLGMKVIEGVSAEGFRSTRTIAAGEVGNEKPIEIVSEQWISSELKAVIYSKRSDPRTGDQIMQMTNIQRVEPPASLFTVPLDFKEAQDERGVIRMRANE
jgi:hypothetical protein